jgi:prepilin-type N-terminal cleavage/methylation domain-containing protein
LVRSISRDESGYSLVEVMVAIMLLGLAIIPMVGMFDAGLRASVVGSNYDRGRAIASEELAEIQALPFSSPDPPAANTDNSVVEIYRPSNVTPAPSPAPPADYACTGTMPTGFSCRVESAYVRFDASNVVPDGTVRTMIQATVNVTWDGGSNSYSTTGLVSKGSE